MKVEVDISLKGDVLDPEGQAILANLKLLGFENVLKVRTRKVFECEMDIDTPEEARAQTQAMCERLLVNQVIEDYKILL